MTDLKIFINCKNPNCIYSAQPIPFSDTGLIEECPLCHSSVAIRYLPKAHKHWLAELYEDPSYWIENIEYDYPSLIAYEYNNLRTLCNDCQPYGVLLSLKDNFETLLKLEILLACSWASANTNETILQNTIVQLMTPNLSLGLWLLIASNILRELEASGYELPKTIPLKTITKQYYKNQIVNWRNTKIGHGAMELAEDENFIADIKERIQFLKNLLTNIDTALRDQEIYYYDDESSERIGNCNIISLTGFQRARMLDREGKVYFRERTTNNGFCVDPFIVIRKHENNGYGVYFFDNQRTINQTHFLAYADGSRKREYVPYFENLRRQLEVGSLNLQAKTDDIFLSEEEIRQLDIPHMSHDYIRPTHIIRWLKRCLESYDKGVFLLKMPRGTGKSVFSEKINRLFNNPETICEDIDVRTYHFSRSQSVGIDDIRYAIEWQWKNEYGKHSWERGKSISDYEKEGYSPSQALCMFLEDVRRYSERTRGRHRIMMVFDGLDEIADTKLWSFIPEDRYINTGIYFLLTSRNTDEEDIPDEIKHRIETIHVQEKHAVDCVSEEHRSFLKDYYRKTQLNKYPDDLFDKIATLSDYRTVYFGMLCKLTENGMNPEYLPDNEKIVEHYLNILRKCYGEKGFAQVKEIIITLCTLGSLEPIGINTLSAIIGENKISLQLIGIIRDVSPILKIERGDKGNRYSIANPDLATQLANQIIEKIEIVRELIQLIISLMKDKKLDEEPGLQVLSYNIVDLAIRWLPEKVQYLTSDTDDLLSDYISNRIQAAYELKDRIEILRHVKQLFNYRKLSLGHEHMMTLSCQAELARLTAELGNYEEALQLYKEVISICQKGNAFDFLTLYNNMANVLCASGRYNEAESLIREVLIISKIMLGETHPTTLSMQSNLAAVLGYMGDYDDALKLKLEDYRKTKEVYGEEHPNTFSALNNLAFTFKDLGRYQDALEMFQKAYIGAKECLGSTHPDTISCLGNLGDTYTALGLYQKAFTIKKHVYEERKKMFGDEHVSTLTIKLELADALESIEQFEDALQEYTGVYEVLRKIYGDENEHVLFVREKIARVLARLGKYESGLKIYEDIYKKCKSSSGEYSHASVRVQKNIGVLMYQCGFLEQGIKQLNSILNKCKNALPPDDSVILEIRMDLGVLFDEVGYSDDAFQQYQIVYELRKKKYSDSNPDTMKAHYEMAVTLRNAGQNKRALQIFQDVYKSQCQIIGESHPDTLETGKSLASSLLALGRTAKALRLYEKIYDEIKNIYGDGYPEALTAKSDIAVTLGKIGRKEQSLKMHQEIYAQRQVLLGESDPDTLNSLNDIASLLLDLKHGSEALECFEEVYAKRCSIFGEENMDTLQPLQGIASSYALVGDKEKAMEIQEEFSKKFLKCMENAPDSKRYEAIIPQFRESLDDFVKLRKSVQRLKNHNS